MDECLFGSPLASSKSKRSLSFVFRSSHILLQDNHITENTLDLLPQVRCQGTGEVEKIEICRSLMTRINLLLPGFRWIHKA